MIFVLTHADFDCSDSRYLDGPEMDEVEFQGLVRSLVPEAGERAVQNAGRMVGHSKRSSRVGWGDVRDEVEALLVDRHGFRPVALPVVRLVGSSIIRDATDDCDLFPLRQSLEVVARHNLAESSERFRREWEQRKGI